ncbi:MAG: hypothetical protein EOO43_03005 [Flavobacterium sp.]|nr:MAG: hypothetical protein EOO43_03005 [Flavobacterium sp.]
MGNKQNKLENIKVLQKALWTSNEPLEIRNDFRDGKEWSLKVQPIGLGVSSVVGTTLTELLALVPSKQLDLLKIDIEGAERYLFADENFISNLEFVKNIIMELHEEYNVGEIVQQSIENSKLFSVTFRGDVNMYVSNR